MQCNQRYYEADIGFMCWINKKPCNKNNCTLKHKFAKKPEVIEGNMKAIEMALNEVHKI